MEPNPARETPTAWRVMLNPRLWNQARFEREFVAEQLFAQSKGRCRMVTLPNRGDTVAFVLRGRIVMRGVVESDGFVRGTAHREDASNVGTHRPHAEAPEFCELKIVEVGLSEAIRPTGQRTWAKMPA